MDAPSDAAVPSDGSVPPDGATLVYDAGADAQVGGLAAYEPSGLAWTERSGNTPAYTAFRAVRPLLAASVPVPALTVSTTRPVAAAADGGFFALAAGPQCVQVPGGKLGCDAPDGIAIADDGTLFVAAGSPGELLRLLGDGGTLPLAKLVSSNAYGFLRGGGDGLYVSRGQAQGVSTFAVNPGGGGVVADNSPNYLGSYTCSGVAVQRGSRRRVCCAGSTLKGAPASAIVCEDMFDRSTNVIHTADRPIDDIALVLEPVAAGAFVDVLYYAAAPGIWRVELPPP